MWAAIALVAETASAQDAGPFEAVPELREHSSVTSGLLVPSGPALGSVAVITRREIERAGYRSVGEALASVPGVFVSYDLVSHHVGMRGLLYGSGGESRYVRVLIDGHPVSLAPTGTQLMGEELIPMSAVERIEVLRGGASALWGVGALSGAIHIVTRRAADGGRVEVDADLSAYGGLGGQSVGGGDGSLAVTTEGVRALVALSGAYHDRSGIALPSESPLTDLIARERGRISATDDRATPLSGYAAMELGLAGGTLGVRVLGQLEDRDATFHRLSVLSDGSRVHRSQVQTSVSFERALSPTVSTRLFAGYARADSLGGDQVVFGSSPYPDVPGQRLIRATRQLTNEELSAQAELLWEPAERAWLTIGVGAEHSRLQPSSYRLFDLEAGAPIDSQTPPTEQHGGAHAYGRLLYPLAPELRVLAAARYDASITSPDSLSARGGLVYSPTPQVSFEAMGHHSYRRPGPDEIFGRPIPPLGGAESLADELERASGAEVALEYLPTARLRLRASAYFDVLELFTPTVRGDSVELEAVTSSVLGGELEARYVQQIAREIDADLGLSASYVGARVSEESFGGLLVTHAPDNEAYPQWMVGANVALSVPSVLLGLDLRYRFVDERVPTATNLRFIGSDIAQPDYFLASYHRLDVSATYGPLDLGADVETHLSVAATNLLGQDHSELGSMGVDVPSIGRTVWARARVTL